MEEDKLVLDSQPVGTTSGTEHPAVLDAGESRAEPVVVAGIESEAAPTEATPIAASSIAAPPIAASSIAASPIAASSITGRATPTVSTAIEEEIPAWLNETAPTPVIKVLIGANIAIFAGMTVAALLEAASSTSGNYNSTSSIIEILIALPTDVLLKWGANAAGVTVLDHQYWRLLTNTFLHTNLIHIGMNMYVLWDFNRLLERLYGSSKFLVIYLLSGLGSSICSLLFLDPSNVSAGASGAIFGIFGATVAFFWAFRKDFPKKFFRMYQKMFFVFLIYTVISSMMFPGMDNAAHLGGFLVGLWTALCLLPSNPASKRWAKGNFLKLSCLTLVLVAGLELDIRMSRDNPQVIGQLEYDRAISLLKKDKFDEAIAQLKKASRSVPSNSAIYADESLAYGKMHRYQDAADAASMALKYNPKDRKALVARAAAFRNIGQTHLALEDYNRLFALDNKSAIGYNNRGWSYLADGNLNQALEDSNKAIKLDPRGASGYDTRGLALAVKGDYDAALTDFAQYIKLKPKDGSVYYHRAYAYFKQGQTDEAKKDLVVARKSDYELEAWEKTLMDQVLKL